MVIVRLKLPMDFASANDRRTDKAMSQPNLPLGTFQVLEFPRTETLDCPSTRSSRPKCSKLAETLSQLESLKHKEFAVTKRRVGVAGQNKHKSEEQKVNL
jgi:hypothetical protein